MSERNTTHAQRVAIIERHQDGESLPQIAKTLGISPYTARKWWRIYRDQGWAGLVPKPNGPPTRGPLSQFDPLVKYVALRLKCQHPAWGLDLLLLAMSRQPSLQGKQLPKRSALHNYLRPFYPRLRTDWRPRTRRPVEPRQRATEVHECWQMDFKGDTVVAQVGSVRPFIVCDEYSAAPLGGIIHYAPDENHPDLTTRHVQADLRVLFTQWGRPFYLRMDRDPRFVGSSRLEWPGLLLLWLAGLGITPIINRPRRPTDNAQVERCNRTWHEHVALGCGYPSLPDIQTATDLAWDDRRALLPSRNAHCNGHPPLVAFPALAQTTRPFSPERETNHFSMQGVYDYLALWEFSRKVDHSGSISLADFNRRISLDHIGQVVKVHFDPLEQMFIAQAVDGTELRRFTLPTIAPDYILGTGGI